MSESGTTRMNCALVELRKALDELCGAAARAGWVVDSWSAYQGGSLDVESAERALGSLTIDGVAVSFALQNVVQARMGRPPSKHAALTDGTTNEAPSPLTTGASNVKVLRPPPGLEILQAPVMNGGDQSETTPILNRSRHFPAGAGNETTNGEKGKASLPSMTAYRTITLLRRPPNSLSTPGIVAMQ